MLLTHLSQLLSASVGVDRPGLMPREVSCREASCQAHGQLLEIVVTCRDISHTPFFVDGRRLGKTSVQEVLQDLLLPDLRANSVKLISAGALCYTWPKTNAGLP